MLAICSLTLSVAEERKTAEVLDWQLIEPDAR
jgi:hypothetical protein